ncbi:outer membrane insertion C-terminal signal domain protein [Anaplasma phagocytophilum str. ApMUC09]|uniref:Outer membrane insertion C-terminal signal domain protein n=1 Tax=Anaplasma phagocytophilum str. ApMUC09 TaxID=1359152 RepID=A0A0F3N7T1_ANAPH|nr:outer membrane insertion C-terminal signal domain protein [Anaplasma phagocytophilum str. ApMUC09]
MSARSRRKLFLGSIMLSFAVLMTSQEVQAMHSGQNISDMGESNYFYVGLNYSPVFSKIRDFTISESSGETKAVYPYLRDGKSVKLETNRFDWSVPDPQIRFKNSVLLAMEGSIGYTMGALRFEVEVGYERFKIKSRYGKGIRGEESDTIYLLAKELAYDVVANKTDALAAALAKVKGQDIVHFANTLKIIHPWINEQICNRGKDYLSSGLPNSKAGSCDSKDKRDGKLRQSLTEALGSQGAQKWPNINNGDEKLSGGKSDGKPYALDASATVAGDISVLDRESKVMVAGLLARTIEGSEIVEIKAISSTSVMLNACYDLFSEGLGIMPYTCIGLGSNFVSIVEGKVTPKLSYKLKAGLSYKFSPEVSAFAGGFYQRVVGDGEYVDLPVKRLSYDLSPQGRTKETAVAKFSMSYVGGEFGIRFAF